MTDNFYLALAAILLLPIIPAYILYKFLPASDTDVSGPYHGLSVKLKGAFAGYFLLVLVGITLQYVIMNNKQERTIEKLSNAVKTNDSTIADLRSQVKGAVTDWYVKGLLTPAGKEGTRFFYDDGTTRNAPDGSFELVKRSLGKEGAANPPKWVCIYNPVTGFRVISLNRELSHPDIDTYNIAFDDANHQITIKKPIEINSIERDSIVAVANFIESNPAIKTQIMQADPNLLEKANIIRKEQETEKIKRATFNKILLEKNNKVKQ